MAASVTGAITRTLLSLSDLAVGQGTSYRLLYEPNFDAGTVTRRRLTVTSPYVDDAFEVMSVRDETHMSMRVNVAGASQSAIQTAVAALIAAVSQQTYTFTLTVGSTNYAWTCRAADYSVGFTTQLLIGLQCPVSLSIPRSPIPVSGPI